ncbi:hypothetical protein PENTCL1PPCAC_11746, partial [Pristionchus entomophagus]
SCPTSQEWKLVQHLGIFPSQSPRDSISVVLELIWQKTDWTASGHLVSADLATTEKNFVVTELNETTSSFSTCRMRLTAPIFSIQGLASASSLSHIIFLRSRSLAKRYASSF